MKVIAENKYYKLAYDEEQNRVYWRMMGYWESMKVVPDFNKDWDATQLLTKPGFMIYGDLSTLKAIPPDVKDAQDKRQALLMKSGCSRVALIILDVAAKFGLNQGLEKNGMGNICKYCSTQLEADNFLNK